jgi:GMT-like wHTH domain
LQWGSREKTRRGFTPERQKDPSQLTLDFGFDEFAKNRSRAALHEQLCDMIVRMIGAEGRAPSVEHLFDANCNDTPVTSAMLKDAILALRTEKELVIRRTDGRVREIGFTLSLSDRVERPGQPPIPGLLKKRNAANE